MQAIPKKKTNYFRWSVKKNLKFLEPHQDLTKAQSVFYSTRRCGEFDATVLENSRQTDPSHFQVSKFNIY